VIPRFLGPYKLTHSTFLDTTRKSRSVPSVMRHSRVLVAELAASDIWRWWLVGIKAGGSPPRMGLRTAAGGVGPAVLVEVEF
jgi:hypothetical protein